VDESGVVKIWNIDRAQGLRGCLLQSLLLHGAVPNHVFSFISAFDNGEFLTGMSVSVSVSVSFRCKQGILLLCLCPDLIMRSCD
jgi:hypothetical protein